MFPLSLCCLSFSFSFISVQLPPIYCLPSFSYIVENSSSISHIVSFTSISVHYKVFSLCSVVQYFIPNMRPILLLSLLFLLGYSSVTHFNSVPQLVFNCCRVLHFAPRNDFSHRKYTNLIQYPPLLHLSHPLLTHTDVGLLKSLHNNHLQP